MTNVWVKSHIGYISCQLAAECLPAWINTCRKPFLWIWRHQAWEIPVGPNWLRPRTDGAVCLAVDGEGITSRVAFTIACLSFLLSVQKEINMLVLLVQNQRKRAHANFFSLSILLQIGFRMASCKMTPLPLPLLPSGERNHCMPIFLIKKSMRSVVKGRYCIRAE